MAVHIPPQNNAAKTQPCKNSFLVGVQTETTTTENSTEIPLKTGNETTIRPSNPITGHIP